MNTAHSTIYIKWKTTVPLICLLLLMHIAMPSGISEQAHIDETVAIEKMSHWLVEVYSLSPEEMLHGELSTVYFAEYDIWQVLFSVPSKDLSASNKLMHNRYYDRNSDRYNFAIFVHGDPDAPTEWETLAEYELLVLIPESAYFSEDITKSRVVRFIEMTIEEKAAFSSTWKTVVDTWLNEHPEFADQDSITHNANYLCTRRNFGVPEHLSFDQKQAESVAISHIESISMLPKTDIEEKSIAYHFYDVTTKDAPLWLVLIDSQGLFRDSSGTYGYLVAINPSEGQVIRSDRVYNSIDRVIELYINN